MSKTRVAILGAGPAGVGAAWQLVKHKKAVTTVVEQRDDVGGNAGSFDIEGLSVDYGSHRLHPACKPDILSDLQTLLKDDLLERPRHGRIRLRGHWIHFPLKPHDLALHLPFSFSAGVARDVLSKAVSKNGNGHEKETFTSVLERGLGSTICRDFYFPYAEKIWGVLPEELSATQAHRRVSAGSLGKMVRKVLSIVPGFKSPGAGKFFYPRGGYGQISRAIAKEAQRLGADIKLNTTVKRIHLGKPHIVEVECEGVTNKIEAEHIWTTIPLTAFARMVEPSAPADVLEASRNISYRAMILIYLVLGQEQWTPFDAHYFPETEIKLTRLSEPKNYSNTNEPKDKTVLCGELPCTMNDEIWNATDEELADMVRDSLERCGLPVNAPVLRVETKRLAFAYPIYRKGYERHFELQDKWIGSLERVLTFGRQGLFAHDNTHHALAMSYAAVDSLKETGEFDMAQWAEYRDEFAKHVVED